MLNELCNILLYNENFGTKYEVNQLYIIDCRTD